MRDRGRDSVSSSNEASCHGQPTPALERIAYNSDISRFFCRILVDLQTDLVSRAADPGKVADDTQGVLELNEPFLSSNLHRWVEEDDLVTNLDFVNELWDLHRSVLE
jgi:hypothetical protein